MKIFYYLISQDKLEGMFFLELSIFLIDSLIKTSFFQFDLDVTLKSHVTIDN
jgi:hypothetical protein